VEREMMNERSLSLYPEEILPNGFKYPARFVEMVKHKVLPDIYPWWFVDANSETGKGFYSRRKRDGRNLVPFAKVDADLNDIACFDGDDVSGNPAVLMLVLDESGRSYSFPDFDAWLSAAEAYAKGLADFLG
jgi:hypothetical protein